MEIHTLEKTAVLYQATKALEIAINSTKEKDLLILFSGGSALKLLDHLSPKLKPNQITLGVLDERFSTDDRINNFLQLNKTNLIHKLASLGAGIISTLPLDNEKPQELARRFEIRLRDWKNMHPEGKVIITSGIGKDGHTAGVLPFPEDRQKFHDLFENSAWVTSFDAAEKNPFPLRVTTTLSFLKDVVDFAVVFVIGFEKNSVLKRLILKQEPTSNLPCMVFWQMKEVQLFTDQKFES